MTEGPISNPVVVLEMAADGTWTFAWGPSRDKVVDPGEGFGTYEVDGNTVTWLGGACDDGQAIASARDSFDLLLSTVNVPLDWNAYLGTLRRQGRLHVLGAVPAPLDIANSELMMANRSVSSSPSGSPTTALTMLDFAARHDIAPVCETYSFDQVNEAIDHLRSGRARFRVVLER